MRFAYEWRDDSGNWFRSYGNELWEFDVHGLMRRRIASINDLPIGRNGPPVPLAGWSAPLPITPASPNLAFRRAKMATG